MTVSTLKIGNREFVVIAKRDFQRLEARDRKLAAQERRDAGDVAESHRRMGERGGVTLAQLRGKLAR